MLEHVSQDSLRPDDLLRCRLAVLPPWDRWRPALHRSHVRIARISHRGRALPQTPRNRSRLSRSIEFLPRAARNSSALRFCFLHAASPAARSATPPPARRRPPESHEVVREKASRQRHNLRTEPERQQRLDQKAHEPSRKNRQQKMREVHLKRRRCQHHNLERRRAAATSPETSAPRIHAARTIRESSRSSPAKAACAAAPRHPYTR